MPFAGYSDFDACTRANQDKRDPDAYCAAIKRQVEGKFDDPPDPVHVEDFKLNEAELYELSEKTNEWTMSDGMWLNEKTGDVVYMSAAADGGAVVKQDVPDDARNIDSRDDAGEDERVVQGPRGGLYAIGENNEESGDDGESDDDDLPEDPFNDFSFDETDDFFDDPLLTTSAKNELVDTIKEEYDVDDETMSSVLRTVESWKADSDGMDEFNQQLADVKDGSIDSDEDRAVKGLIDASVEFAKEHFGDEMEVYRGVEQDVYNEMKQEGDEIEVEQKPSANYSLDEEQAETYGQHFAETRDTDDVILFADSLLRPDFNLMHEMETFFTGGTREIDKDDVELIS